MNSSFKLSRKEVAVVFLTLFFLVMTLGAASRKSHVHAKRMICKSNLEQLYRTAFVFINDNDGYFADADWNDDGRSDIHGQWWIQSIKPYIGNQDVLLCSVARQHPAGDYPGDVGRPNEFHPVNSNQCWGSRDQVPAPTAGEWTWASYAPNAWIMDIRQGSWIPQNMFWGKLDNVTDPSTVPLFQDSRWVDVWPRETDTPPIDENGTSGIGSMRMLLQNNHGNGVTMGVFVDGSARDVGLKELWRLKWHKEFNTNNPYTQPNAPWPLWMQGFQDY